MLDSHVPLPFPYRLINSIGNILTTAKLPIVQLNEDIAHKAAMKLVNLTDFGDPYYQEGLTQLIKSFKKDVNLNFMGRLRARERITDFLVCRLLMTEARKQTSHIFNKPLIPPIIIMGMFRTGSTLLHRLLAADPANRAIPLWELSCPFPRSPDNRRDTIEKQVNIIRSLIPDFDTKHFLHADEPEECAILLGKTFISTTFWNIATIHGYIDWYLQQDHVKKYQEYRWMLQYYQSEYPTRRLTLKSPEHTGSLTELLQSIPNALIIQTHRDPTQCINSYNSLLYSEQMPSTDNLDVKKMAETTLRMMSSEVKRNLAAREKYPDKVFDVQYEQLVTDPIGTVKGIYNHFGLTWSEEYERVLNDYLQKNPKGKHGTHRYCSTDFGLTDAEIAEQFVAYSEKFGFTK